MPALSWKTVAAAATVSDMGVGSIHALWSWNIPWPSYHVSCCRVHSTSWRNVSRIQNPTHKFLMHNHLGCLIYGPEHRASSLTIWIFYRALSCSRPFSKLTAFASHDIWAGAVFLDVQCIPPVPEQVLCCLLCDGGWRLKQVLLYFRDIPACLSKHWTPENFTEVTGPKAFVEFISHAPDWAPLPPACPLLYILPDQHEANNIINRHSAG